MAEFPALPLWTDAYLGDTTHLTTIEHGAYLLLLMTAWRTRDARLPDDDRLLARYTRLGPKQWLKMRAILEPFFVVANGFWTQRRLTDEADAVRQLRERQSAKGKASALKRKGRHSTGDKSGSTGSQPDANPAPTSPTPTPSSVDKSTGGEPPDPVKELFDVGVSVLTACGQTEKEARSLIGKWRKASSDSDVLAGLIDCRARAISAPVEWMQKRLGGGSQYVSESGYRYRGDEDAVMREAEKRADWPTYYSAKANLGASTHA